jgi:lipopolysaccharide/colanic/teichoic acid biosynthesis glycosyltransferase
MILDRNCLASAQVHQMKLTLAQATAAVALIPGFPLMALTAAITALLVGRPLMFRQVRAGYLGKPFEILKFRTMTSATDENGLLLPDALRTTFATRFLRRTRLDELPQLISIVRGDMTLIGPRPLLPTTIEELGIRGTQRCTVKPGLTGWSQVNGNTLLTNDQKVALDLWYVEHRSIWIDFNILARTIWTVVHGERINCKHLDAAQTHVRRSHTYEAGIR